MMVWIKLDSHGLFNDPIMVYVPGEIFSRIQRAGGNRYFNSWLNVRGEKYNFT